MCRNARVRPRKDSLETPSILRTRRRHAGPGPAPGRVRPGRRPSPPATTCASPRPWRCPRRRARSTWSSSSATRARTASSSSHAGGLAQAQGAGVRFRRSPVPFLQNFRNFQPMYFALEALGLADTLPRRSSTPCTGSTCAWTSPRTSPRSWPGTAWTRRVHGASPRSAPRVKVSQADRLFQASGGPRRADADGAGRFLTSPSTAHGETKALAAGWTTSVAQVRAGH